ncbi:MAG: four helix bundle protein [bacterium]|nr:four helix bundle protein [bacterium]
MNSVLKSFKDLIVWQKAADLASLVYVATEKFPRSELYGLTSQMRRSAVSISSNIAEGFKRNHKKEKTQFYNVAYGSVAELESQTEIALKLDFLDKGEYQKSNALIIEVSKMLDGLIKSVNKSPKSYILNSKSFLSMKSPKS